MACRDFTLDFTGQSGVPSQWGIDHHQVARWFGQQSKGVHGIQVISDRRRGVFNVSAINNDAAIFLSGFKLIAEKHGKRIEIPLREKRRRSANAVWIGMHRTCEGDMSDLPNSYFDDFISGFGHQVVEPTTRSTYFQSSILNGQRRALVELADGRHLSRTNFWHSEDEKIEPKEWIMTYRGQPYKCRKCDDTWHEDGNCPKWVERSQMEKREGQQKYLFFSSSMLRSAVDTEDVRFDCVPGAKIGHIANHINFDISILPKAEIVVVMAGQNMGGGTIQELKMAVKEQTAELSKAIEPYCKDKDVFVVDPVSGPIPAGLEGDEARLLRSELKRCAAGPGATFIPMEAVNLMPVDMEPDEIHFSPAGTKKVLSHIRDFIKRKKGIDILGNFKVSDRPYGGVKGHHFKVGCYRCTRIHPKEDGCPPSIMEDPPSSPTPAAAAAALTPTPVAVAAAAAPEIAATATGEAAGASGSDADSSLNSSSGSEGKNKKKNDKKRAKKAAEAAEAASKAATAALKQQQQLQLKQQHEQQQAAQKQQQQLQQIAQQQQQQQQQQ